MRVFEYNTYVRLLVGRCVRNRTADKVMRVMSLHAASTSQWFVLFCWDLEMLATTHRYSVCNDVCGHMCEI